MRHNLAAGGRHNHTPQPQNARHNRPIRRSLDDSHDASIKLMPDSRYAYIDRGTAPITMKRYDDAFSDINKGISRKMSYPYLGYYNRAVAEELMERFKDSYYGFKHVLELEPNYSPATELLKLSRLQ